MVSAASLCLLLLQAVMSELHSYNFLLRTFVSAYMNSLGVDLFLTKTVHEYLWGFKHPLLAKIHKLRPEVDEYFGLMWKVSAAICALITQIGGMEDESHVFCWLLEQQLSEGLSGYLT